ncbi:MAG: FtsH protease activity modulator HflK [Sphingomonadales bacterium]
MGWGNDNGKGQNPWGSVPPGGGRGGGNGGPPPEYDDIIGKFQENFKNMMPGFLKGKGFVFILVLILAILILPTIGFRVQTAEQGVVLMFGKWVRTAPEGFNFKLPFPIEQVTIVNVNVISRIDVGFRSPETRDRNTNPVSLLEESLMLTGDENIVDIAFTVFWKIDNAKNYLFNIQEPQAITIKEVAESVMREIIGKTPIQTALTQGRGQIQKDSQEKLQEVLNYYEAGILVTEIRLERVDPPAQVIDAFRDVQKAEADKESFQNQAQAYANSIVPEARGNAVRMTQEAEAYKEQVIARATGEASRFLAVFQEYAKAKDVTKRRIYYETMEELLAGMNKIIIDEGAGTGVVPYLPLPEIRPNQDKGGDNE